MHLDFTRTVSQLEKRRLAERSQRNHSSGQVVSRSDSSLQLLGALLPMRIDHIGGQVLRSIAIPPRVETELAPFARLLEPGLVDFVLFFTFAGSRFGICHGARGRGKLTPGLQAAQASAGPRFGFLMPISCAVMKSSIAPSRTASTLPVSTPVRWSLTRR